MCKLPERQSTCNLCTLLCLNVSKVQHMSYEGLKSEGQLAKQITFVDHAVVHAQMLGLLL